MVRRDKLLDVARRGGGASLKFKQLCALLESVGFEFDRQAGSHKIFRHPTRSDVPRVNVQEGKGGSVKPYQVKQVLRIIDDCSLEVKE